MLLKSTEIMTDLISVQPLEHDIGVIVCDWSQEKGFIKILF